MLNLSSMIFLVLLSSLFITVFLNQYLLSSLSLLSYQDFGGCHPDPNLTYAKELVHAMGVDRTGQPIEIDSPVPDFGCATGLIDSI